MSISSRLSCAAIALALLPCWAVAQSAALGNATTDPSAAGSQLSAERVAAPSAPDGAVRPGDIATEHAIGALAATLSADPFASPASAPEGSDKPAAEAAGPTAASATAGISAQKTGRLSRQQLADRADHDRGSVGRDAALMIVGGAALIVGLIVAGPGGYAIAVIGAVMGLTGLFLYLR